MRFDPDKDAERLPDLALVQIALASDDYRKLRTETDLPELARDFRCRALLLERARGLRTRRLGRIVGGLGLR